MHWTKTLAASWAILALTLTAQTPTPAPAPALPLVVVDPAHGGADGGAKFSDTLQEKTLTLAMAQRLRSMLSARGFAVRMTHEGDDTLPADARAGLANGTHAVACVSLHATPAGSGVHLYTSALSSTYDDTTISRWDEAQVPYLDRSQKFASEVQKALGRSGTTVLNGHTWMPELDSMQCPALVVEVAPKSAGESISDSYQQQVLESISGALLFYKNFGPPPPAATAGDTTK